MIASTCDVDGDGTEWNADKMTEKEGLEVSVANDDKDLYVYVAAKNRDTAEQLAGKFRQTFTLWLDGKGGKKKVYGIKITAGPKEEERKLPQQPSADQSGERALPPPPTFKVGIVDGEDSDAVPLETAGVEFKPGLNNRKRPLFEFKIPLAKWAAKGADIVRVGFETSEIYENSLPGRPDSASGSRGGRSGGPGGGMNGPGGDRGGPPGGGRSGGSDYTQGPPALPDPIDFWLKIKLAPKP